MSEPAAPEPAFPQVQLKDPILAGFLAWFVPGLGHYYQGRRAKAVLYFVCIMGLFVYGCYLGGGAGAGPARVVYFSFRPTDMRLHYVAQAAVGLPALPALIQGIRASENRQPLLSGFMAPPPVGEGTEDNPSLAKVNRRLGRFFELGTAFTMIAGLLNILAIYDACCGPVFEEPRRKKEGPKKKENGEKDDATPDEPSPKEPRA
jgi:hypothetical protein